ncbi:MAG: hypothetical protein M3N32_11125 [Actinomycetota bacterium]|nr:hypothetical protein [Actinomycetota bacterium]
MAERQETRVEPGEAWTQTMQGFTNAAVELVGQTMHWQQDLVRLWVDTQQQLAGFWMQSQEETARTGRRTDQTTEPGSGRRERQ